MRITIKDIAKKLGVHHSTVSRALRFDARIKEETGNAIRDYANKNGYYLNVNALKFRGTLRNTIALIVPNISHRFFSNIVNLLTDLAYHNNYVISVYQSNESYEHECSFIKKIIQQDVAGVIASVSDKTTNGEHFRELMRMKIPLVFFDRILKDVGTSSVTTNNSEITAQLVSQLVSTGRKRIANISGPDHINVFHDRNFGYQKCIQDSKLAYNRQITIEGMFSLESGKDAAKKLYDSEIQPDAIISSSFLLTMGIVNFLREKNIRIPVDVAVAGFGDRLFNSLLHPDIISIEQPEEELASSAFNLLLDQIAWQEDLSNYKHKTIELKSRIINIM